jgi:hypothetical protein
MPRTAAAAPTLDPAGERLGGFRVRGIIDDDGEAVGREPLRDGGADAARGSGDDRYFTGLVGHVFSLTQ